MAARGVKLTTTMDSWIILVILAVCAIPVVVGLSRLSELFVVDVNDGKATLRRGRVPPRLLADMRDVVKQPAVASASVRVTIENTRPMLRVTSGAISDAQVQRLRNVVGTWTTKQIREGARKA